MRLNESLGLTTPIYGGPSHEVDSALAHLVLHYLLRLRCSDSNSDKSYAMSDSENVSLVSINIDLVMTPEGDQIVYYSAQDNVDPDENVRPPLITILGMMEIARGTIHKLYDGELDE